jgi:tetratricopeptide (TPR) repeat protein
MIGQSLGPYRIVATLGAGGMGVVYKAEDTRLGRHVAVKFLPDALSSGAESLARFQREARAASALNHPGICTVFDIGEHEGRPFIVLEHLDGQTLRQRLEAGALGTDEVLDLGIQIAAALDAAHEAGIVHRDVKPANIVVTRRGHAKILDFGLAKVSTPAGEGTAALTCPAADLTNPGTAVGTVAYMSPEQALGRELDRRTDVFSLGVVLYEMATGRRPFAGATTAALYDEILHRTPPSIVAVKAGVPLELGEVVAKALEKDPTLRYPTAGALAADLRRLQRDLGRPLAAVAGVPRTTATEPDAGSAAAVRDAPPTPARAGRRLGARALAALGAALALAAAAWGLWQGRTAGTRPLGEADQLLLTDFVNNTGDPVFDDALKTALGVKLAESPFLNVVSDTAVHETLRLMERPPDTRVTPALGREICLRRNGKAMMRAEIASVGSRYLLTLQAEDCHSGNVVGRAQAEAKGKDDVLAALDRAASAMRRALGESLASIAKTDTPLAQATTSSLEALKAYSLAVDANSEAQYAQAAALCRRALDIDGGFAAAHYQLSVNLTNLSDVLGARLAAEKAFELRHRISERERITIEETFFYTVTQELDKAIESLEIGVRTYPREREYWNNLGLDYLDMGRHEDAIARLVEAVRLEPGAVRDRLNLSAAYRHTGRLVEAKAAVDPVIAGGTPSRLARGSLYLVAFVKADHDEMGRLAAWFESHPAGPGDAGAGMLEGLRLAEAAHFGRIGEFRRLRPLALGADSRDWTGPEGWRYLAGDGGWALVEALTGNLGAAEDEARRMLTTAGTTRERMDAALALSTLGKRDAETIAADLVSEYPRATLWNRLVVPTIRANLALAAGDAQAALEALRPAEPYALAPGSGLMSVYARGRALLALRRGQDAAAEFQRIVDRPGISVFAVVHPLARLGLARATALKGDANGARRHYEGFFAMWKDADPDVPVLREARAEFARLK